VSQSVLKDATRPALVVTGGALDGTVLTLDQSSEKVIGSGPDCHLRVPAENVAALHARVAWDARGVLLTDAGGPTGTFVNGEKAGTAQPLQDGDRVSLGPPGSKGSVKLVVRLPAGVAFAGDDLIVVDADEPAAAPASAAPSSADRLAQALVPPPSSSPARRSTATPAAEDATEAPPDKPTPEKRRARPEYHSEMPSIVDDHMREQAEPAPVVRPPARPKVVPKVAKGRGFALPILPRTVVVGLVTTAVAGGAVLLYFWIRPPRPIMTAVNPIKAEPGQSLTVTGTGFDPSPARNKVLFGSEAGQVTSASPTQLAVVVPASLAATGAANLQVTVETRGGASNAIFVEVYRGPRITALQPDVAMPGDEILIAGQNLSGQGASVTFGGIAGEVGSADAAGLKVRVPNLPVAEGRTVDVQVQAGSEASAPVKLTLGRLPLVTEVTPNSGRAGDRVVLKGKGFDAHVSGNAVQFGADRAMVISASPTELVVVAPAPSMAGSQVQGRIVVQSGGRTSSGGKSFTVLRPSTAAYQPRYFPAFVTEHPTHDHVFVSTELGPVFLLTGKGDAPSTAERAVRAAAGLNTLIESAAAGKPATVEARDASVGVGGALLLTATPEDVAGYAEGWEGSGRGAPVTTRSLASYWAALIRDHLTLFVERQRPHFVLEMSPRGKVLVDLYAEAGRRVGPGNGVPPGLVSPLPASQAKAMRDLALLLPAPGQASASAGITGTWEGSTEEGGAGSRAIRIRLQLQGGHLAGTMATKAGKIAMETPLSSVSYDRGVLAFVLQSGGTTRRFSGTVQGGTINGTIRQEGRGGEPEGRFTLRYVE
jgi:pSer/pThr/pTyr-binding forkhead associated (FHA) protein